MCAKIAHLPKRSVATSASEEFVSGLKQITSGIDVSTIGKITRPKIAICMIARNSSKTITDAIQSIAGIDYLCLTDTGSTDNTIKLAKKACIKSGVKLILSEFTWIDNFAAARNFNLTTIPADTDWIMWMDSDDVLDATNMAPAQAIREIIAKTPDRFGCIWLPYFYAQDEFGNTTTVFIRERILKKSIGWKWQGRVHETVAPLTKTEFIKNNDLVVKHNHKGNESKSDRNFKLLYQQLREEPDNLRTMLYLGHQHFADMNWEKAVEYYLKYAQNSDKIPPIERYQALTYASRALRNIRHYKEAIDCDLLAIDLFPQWADGYIGMALNNLGLSLPGKANYWAQQAKDKQMPDELIFVNPLDYTFNLSIALGDSYAQLGNIPQAIQAWTDAHTLRPIPELKSNIDSLKEGQSRSEVIRGLKALCTDLIKNNEVTKLKSVVDTLPWWLYDIPEGRVFIGEITQAINKFQFGKLVLSTSYQKQVTITNLEHLSGSVDDMLYKLEQFADEVNVVIDHSDKDRIRFISQTELEWSAIKPHRRIIQLYTDGNKLICNFDHKVTRNQPVWMILTGPGLEQWNPQTIETKGIGGSELAAARVAEGIADIYGSRVTLIGSSRGIYNYVIYRDKFQEANCDIFISSRIPQAVEHSKALVNILWVHDIDCGPSLTPELASKYDLIIVLSNWHLNHMKAVYPFLSDCPVIDHSFGPNPVVDSMGREFHKSGKCSRLPTILVMPNGIDTGWYIDIVPRLLNSFIWSSAPDRGLVELLTMWPLIRKELPTATLNIYYGWEYFDHSLSFPGQAEIKSKIIHLLDQLKSQGVRWHGRVSQPELAEAMLQSDIWLYPPHDFRETCCITAIEAQAAGVLCIYRPNGALPETVGARGVVLPVSSLAGLCPPSIVSALPTVPPSGSDPTGSGVTGSGSVETQLSTVVSAVVAAINSPSSNSLRQGAKHWALEQDWSNRVKVLNSIVMGIYQSKQ